MRSDGTILGEALASQYDIHKEWGGVVPGEPFPCLQCVASWKCVLRGWGTGYGPETGEWYEQYSLNLKS